MHSVLIKGDIDLIAFQWCPYRGIPLYTIEGGREGEIIRHPLFLFTLTVMRAKALLQSCHGVVYSRGFFLYPRTDGRSLAGASSATPTEEEKEMKVTTPTCQRIILS